MKLLTLTAALVLSTSSFAAKQTAQANVSKTCFNEEVRVEGDLTVGEEWRGGKSYTRFCKTIVYGTHAYCTEESREYKMRINCDIFELVQSNHQ